MPMKYGKKKFLKKTIRNCDYDDVKFESGKELRMKILRMKKIKFFDYAKIW